MDVQPQLKFYDNDNFFYSKSQSNYHCNIFIFCDNSFKLSEVQQKEKLETHKGK